MNGVIRWIIIAAVVLLILVIAFIVTAIAVPGFSAVARDIAIVILAVFQFIGAFLTIALLITVLYAIKSLHELIQLQVVPRLNQVTAKVDGVLDNTRSVMRNVRESSDTITTTTVYTAERVVSPLIRVSSLIVGVRAAARAMAHLDDPLEQPEPVAADTATPDKPEAKNEQTGTS